MELALALCCDCCQLVLTAIPILLSALSFSNLLHIKKEADWRVLKFLAVVDGIVCAYYALSWILACILISVSKSRRNLPVLVLHSITTALMLSACMVAAYKVYIDKHSREHIAMTDLCGRLSRPCDRIASSVALSSSAGVVCFILTIITACGLSLAESDEDEDEDEEG